MYTAYRCSYASDNGVMETTITKANMYTELRYNHSSRQQIVVTRSDTYNYTKPQVHIVNNVNRESLGRTHRD